jgi:hypothetical protein
MGITAQAAKHGVQSGTDGFDSLADHGFGTIDKEIDGKATVHGRCICLKTRTEIVPITGEQTAKMTIRHPKLVRL